MHKLCNISISVNTDSYGIVGIYKATDMYTYRENFGNLFTSY